MIEKLKYNAGEIVHLTGLIDKINEIADAVNGIAKESNSHKHDHDYFHDDCGLCQIEKAEFDKL